uniref:Peptide transporter PTR2 n=1 Tax=Aegilops tauschii TaxID=37682 RepID=M8BN65_AEGTA
MRKQQGLSGDGDGEWDKWVDDSSVDHRGRPPLRAATGSWRAAMFIILIEFSERLSYFGIATSLMIYLTKVLHQDMKVAAVNSQYWMSVTTLMPLLGGFLADAYLGRFRTVLLSTVVYLLGLVLLAEYFYDQMPETMRSLGIGLYLSVIGAGSFLSSQLIAAASRLSSHGGRRDGWFGKDLSRSRLDLFSWLLAAISAANLGFYVLVATRYSYKQQTAKAGRVGADKDAAAGDVECAIAAAA